MAPDAPRARARADVAAPPPDSQRGQAAPSDLAARDLKAELSSRERQHLDKKREAEEEAGASAFVPRHSPSRRPSTPRLSDQTPWR